MTKIIGALIWCEEDPVWLMAAVTSIAPALDHLVALDGKYALYPGALSKPASDALQSVAIVEACASVNLGLTLSRPNQPYFENEVGKRNASLALARQVADSDDDWVIVFDGDMIARKASANVKKVLSESAEGLVGEYARYDAPEDDGFQVVRGVYRLVPGLEYGPAHYTISAPMSDGTRLWFWGQPHIHRPYVTEVVNLMDDLQFDHRNTQRSSARNNRAHEFYKMRDQLGIEKLTDVYMEGLDGQYIKVEKNGAIVQEIRK